MNDLLNSFFDLILYNLIVPLFKITDSFLFSVFYPLLNHNKYLFILTVAFSGALLSLGFSFLFKNREDLEKINEFKERINTLRHLNSLEDEETRMILKKGINSEADTLYEKILIRSFFNSCLTYFIPMCLFLIWLDLSKINNIINSDYIFGLNKEFVFIIFFNLYLLVFYIVKKIITAKVKYL